MGSLLGHTCSARKLPAKCSTYVLEMLGPCLHLLNAFLCSSHSNLEGVPGVLGDPEAYVRDTLKLTPSFACWQILFG